MRILIVGLAPLCLPLTAGRDPEPPVALEALYHLNATPQ